MLVDFVNRGWTFSIEESLLWIMNWYFDQKDGLKLNLLIMDLFHYSSLIMDLLLTFQDVNDELESCQLLMDYSL